MQKILSKITPTINTIEIVFRISCAIMLIGHGWVCLNGKMPLTALLWDEELMSGLITSITGEDWNSWVTSLEVGDAISNLIKAQGILFIFFAVTILIKSQKKWFNYIYIIISINLLFLAVLKYLDSRVGIGNLLEHASQFCMPLIIFFIARDKSIKGMSLIIAKVSIAFAFIFHGLFAINFRHEMIIFDHARPGHFTEMVMLSLGINQESLANSILVIAGILDFISAALIFSKGTPRNIGLLYMLIWGSLTAMARPWSRFDSYEIVESLNIWIPEMLYRAPHFMIPVCLLLALKTKSEHGELPLKKNHT